MGALKCIVRGFVLSSAVGLIGFIAEHMFPGAWGAAADVFFGMLAAGLMGEALAPVLAQRFLSARVVSRSRWLSLALATGMAIIRYLEVEGGGFNAADIAITVVVIVALAPMLVSWTRLARREVHAQRDTDARPAHGSTST